MLALLHRHQNAIERDLARVYGVRYSDRWRFDENGHRRLTLREIWVFIEDLPPDSSLVKAMNEGKPGWGLSDHLTADLWHALTGKPHPLRPQAEQQKQANAKRARAMREVNARFAARNKRTMAASTKAGGDS
ncbi:hypothetical protein ABZ413_29570 [Nocardia rhamnosiphila]|uniref:hypothetical protein n=1 Tax=Nocardia rhamnosiphila TaxID=426716 RepID=UPI0033FB864F